ncbi:MAG: TonB-dependent receptor [Xanthomonadales bacterium]|nr:TonB-dependent receptor [Xanthomonadales bacterium]
MRSLKPNLLALAVAFALLPLPASAQPQPAEEEESDAAELEKVTVTARRVREPEQEVPLSITAITEQQIEQRGMFDVRDVARYSAAFSFRSAFGRIGDRPVIRGMSNIQGQPNASFFIDGIFVPGSISGYNLDNLERVEVIRGPQSALFGRRTFSGAINFVTRAPTDEFRAKVSLGGGNDDFGELRSYLSGPLVEGLIGAEVNFSHREIGSRFFNNQTRRRDIGAEQTTTVGGVLALRTDVVDARLRYHYLRNDDEHAAIFRQGSDLNNCFLPTLTGQVVGGIPLADSRRRGYFCGEVQLRPERFAINTDQFELAGVPAGLFREASRSSLAIDWTLPNNWLFSSISAYNDTELYSAFDQDYSGIRGFNGAFETFEKTRTFDLSQEFRITTDTSRDWYVMLGAYYYRETQGEGYTGSLSGFNIPPANNRNPPVANRTRPQDRTENLALFGLLEWRISPEWRATFEARYAEDKILVAGTRSTVLTVGGVPRTFTRSFRLSETFTNFLPRVTLSYFPSDEWMWYGLVSKGNKPGGFNLDVQNPVLTEQARNELIAAGFESFDEEEAWNWELGFKSDWAGPAPAPQRGAVLHRLEEPAAHRDPPGLAGRRPAVHHQLHDQPRQVPGAGPRVRERLAALGGLAGERELCLPRRQDQALRQPGPGRSLRQSLGGREPSAARAPSRLHRGGALRGHVRRRLVVVRRRGCVLRRLALRPDPQPRRDRELDAHRPSPRTEALGAADGDGLGPQCHRRRHGGGHPPLRRSRALHQRPRDPRRAGAPGDQCPRLRPHRPGAAELRHHPELAVLRPRPPVRRRRPAPPSWASDPIGCGVGFSRGPRPPSFFPGGSCGPEAASRWRWSVPVSPVSPPRSGSRRRALGSGSSRPSARVGGRLLTVERGGLRFELGAVEVGAGYAAAAAPGGALRSRPRPPPASGGGGHLAGAARPGASRLALDRAAPRAWRRGRARGNPSAPAARAAAGRRRRPAARRGVARSRPCRPRSAACRASPRPGAAGGAAAVARGGSELQRPGQGLGAGRAAP